MLWKRELQWFLIHFLEHGNIKDVTLRMALVPFQGQGQLAIL
jgi:hypothetical protein